MRRVLVCLVLLSIVAWSPAEAEETYDLIFKTGTLSDISRQSTLTYDRTVEYRDESDLSDQQSGEIELTFEADEMARLKFVKGDKYRNVGAFPATVGNPIIMYFVETVIRDVAHRAGGSPFYIRNRIKASLLQKVPIVEGTERIGDQEVPVRKITLRPFVNDKNRSKMRGFEDLALTITMSDEIPGWYHSLVADTKALNGSESVYSNTLTFTAEGQSQ